MTRLLERGQVWNCAPLGGGATRAIGLINLIYNLARYEQTRLLPRGQVVRLKLLPRTAACLRARQA